MSLLDDPCKHVQYNFQLPMLHTLILRFLFSLLFFWLNPCSLWAISTLTSDWTWTPSSKSMDSQPLDCQGIPVIFSDPFHFSFMSFWDCLLGVDWDVLCYPRVLYIAFIVFICLSVCCSDCWFSLVCLPDQLFLRHCPVCCLLPLSQLLSWLVSFLILILFIVSRSFLQ